LRVLRLEINRGGRGGGTLASRKGDRIPRPVPRTPEPVTFFFFFFITPKPRVE